MAGEVRTDGAELTVRFDPGTDPERKAARLDSELVRLRARMAAASQGAALWVEPATERNGDFLALVWLAGAREDADARAAAEVLKAVPGVREVELVGVRDEADPLRGLVLRLALAGLLGVGLAAAAGAWRGGLWGALALGLALPAVVAAAANAFLLAGVPLDVTTLAALAVAAAGLLPLAALRLTRRDGFWTWGLTAIAAAAAVPVAVALASAELGPLLAEPARAFLLAVAVGVGAVALLPRPHGTPSSPGGLGLASPPPEGPHPWPLSRPLPPPSPGRRNPVGAG